MHGIHTPSGTVQAITLNIIYIAVAYVCCYGTESTIDVLA